MGNHRIMAIFNKAPYERISVVEGTRALAGVATMGIDGTAVFVDDGVYALVKKQKPAGTHLEPLIAWLKLLETSKVPIKIVLESLVQRGIEASDLMELSNLETINVQRFSELVLDYDSVFVI